MRLLVAVTILFLFVGFYFLKDIPPQAEPTYSLSEKQRIFTLNVAKLIIYAYDQGYELTIGECWRPKVTQEYYVKIGKSKTYNSQHLVRLAIDFNLFYKGRYEDGRTKESFERYKVLGEYWKSLNPHNRWGGDFGWDPGHFEYK